MHLQYIIRPYIHMHMGTQVRAHANTQYVQDFIYTDAYVHTHIQYIHMHSLYIIYNIEGIYTYIMYLTYIH